MNITKDQYQQMLQEKSPNSPLWKDMIWAFVVGGLICILGQWIQNLWKSTGLDPVQAGSATSITLVFLGAFFTGLGWYDKLAKHAGAGTIVPITGFSNAIAAPAIEFRSEGLVLGLAAKMFVIAGPVLVYGISASVIYGLIVYFFNLV